MHAGWWLPLSQKSGSPGEDGGMIWSTHCATTAHLSSKWSLQNWFSGCDKNHFEYLSQRVVYPRCLALARFRSLTLSRSICSEKWSEQKESEVRLLQPGCRQKCMGLFGIRSPLCIYTSCIWSIFFQNIFKKGWSAVHFRLKRARLFFVTPLPRPA